jgi:N-acyl-D-amino-acid deacylase
MGQKLDFNPGERHEYSNVGYLLLGRIIEAVTGESYESFVKKEVLAPLKIESPQLGRALLEHRANKEVVYYDSGKRTGPCVFPPTIGKVVPVQYGADNLEGYEAHGGWIASAVDLVKFASAFDNPAKSPLLQANTIAAMFARPEGRAGLDESGQPSSFYYGCGWSVRPVGTDGKANTWHGGYIAGTEAFLVRRSDGLNWAVLFNTAGNPEGKMLQGLIDSKLHEVANQVKRWPRVDLFSKYLKS